MIKKIGNKSKKSIYNLIYKRNIVNMENLKVTIENHIKRKNKIINHLLFELFYEKCNHILMSKELIDKVCIYYDYLNEMIEYGMIYKRLEFNENQRDLVYLMDLMLHKNPYYKKSLLIKNEGYKSDKNEFYKYNNNEEIFVKKSFYVKNKVWKDSYEVEIEILDILNELLIQYNLYKYFENKIECKLINYNPISQIHNFSHNICIIDDKGDIYNDIYIEMENINGIRFDKYIYQKMYKKRENVVNDEMKGKEILRDVINGYTVICRLLSNLQKDMSFIHCDLKGSNIMIGNDRKVRLIDFEYSYIKKDNYSIFSHYDFLFEHNYDIFTNKSVYTLDLIKLYSSKYRFCTDLLYLFMATLNYGNNDEYGIQKIIIDKLFRINNVNMFKVLIQNKLPFEAYVYSKDMELLEKICIMYNVNFNKFIRRFFPENCMNLLSELLN